MEGGRGGYLARLVLDPQRPLVCWPVGEGGCRRRFGRLVDQRRLRRRRHLGVVVDEAMTTTGGWWWAEALGASPQSWEDWNPRGERSRPKYQSPEKRDGSGTSSRRDVCLCHAPFFEKEKIQVKPANSMLHGVCRTCTFVRVAWIRNLSHGLVTAHCIIVGNPKKKSCMHIFVPAS
jgi:hypothetical protein